MAHGKPPRGRQGFPAQQRDWVESSEWHDCAFWYTAEEVAEINRIYGWEKYRLVPEQNVQKN